MLYSVLHRPGSRRPHAPGVVIVPPFGWQEVCSERGRLEWADALARAGYPTLRFDLPGTAESGGSPRDEGLFDSWLLAVAEAAVCLRRECGVERVVALGLGMGAGLALRSLASEAQIDGLMLWGARAHGRRYIREMKAHSTIAAARWPSQPEGSQEVGVLELTGYLMTEATAAAVSAMNIEELDLEGAGRPVLVLGRSDLGIDGGLVQALATAGFEVEVKTCSGYVELMDDHPDRNRRPSAAIEASLAWLASWSDPAGAPEPEAAMRTKRESSVNFSSGYGTWSEELVARPTAFGLGSGVLCEPSDPESDDVCFVFMNHGTRRRCGPNRMWVEASRRWAGQGYKAARVDLDGLGDSDGERNSEATRQAIVESLCAWLDDIARRGFASRFVLVGLSAGALNSLGIAGSNPRVAGVIAVNPMDVRLSEAYSAELRRRRVIVTLRDACVSLLRGQTPPRVSAHAVLQAVAEIVRGKGVYKEARRQRRQLPAQFSQWRDRGVRVSLYLGRSERILEWLEEEKLFPRLWEWPNIALEAPQDVWDHDVRALWVQRAVHVWMDKAAEGMLPADGRWTSGQRPSGHAATRGSTVAPADSPAAGAETAPAGAGTRAPEAEGPQVPTVTGRAEAGSARRAR